MQLFYAPDLTTPLYTLGEEESKHCIRVLRLRRGDTLHLTDGRGTLYRCEIAEEDARRCTVRVVERFPDYERMPYRLTMAVAPTKNIERFEWFLEKATEVGVSEIVPLLCERSERRALKIERAERVVVSAMKQSLKAFCPALRPLTPLPTCSPSRSTAAADRPLRRAPYGKTPSVRHAPPARKPAGAHRPRRRLLAR